MGGQSSGLFGADISYPIRFFFILSIGALCWLEPFCLPEKSVAGLMMILAQGHFLLSYLYQFRAGKMNQGYARRYFPFAIVLFGACLFTPMERLIEGITGAYFVIHFFYDERYLLREKAEFSGWKFTLPTIVLLSTEVIYRYAIAFPVWLYIIIFALCATGMAWMVLRAILSAQGFSVRNVYFLGIFGVAALLTLSGKLLPGPVNLNAINFIILVHFGNWYLSYVLKLRTQRVLFRKFLLETIVVNGVMGGLMFLFVYPTSLVFLSGLTGLLYSRPYFHAWTILHYVATYRPADVMNWVPARNSA
ncbi:MAG: hypothetical protein J0L53_09975 [Spirochaetes bacterium]|nr:hypothetical protein [Spirochaetota bacterium]